MCRAHKQRMNRVYTVLASYVRYFAVLRLSATPSGHSVVGPDPLPPSFLLQRTQQLPTGQPPLNLRCKLPIAL